MAEPADADHPHARARADLPLTQRRPGGDAGAEERRHPGRIEMLGDAEHELLVHHDARGVPALRGPPRLLFGAAVGARHAVVAILLEAIGARPAVAAAVHHAPHAHQIPGFPRRDSAPDRFHPADDFVPRNLRVLARAPLAAHGVEVRVTDSAVHDADVHVVGAHVATLEAPRGEWSGRVERGNADGRYHDVLNV